MIPTNQQQAVITAPLQPLRVAAAAGTGKTSTMALRLEHLITTHGLDPETCLGITFTNKAAEQLQRTLRDTLPDHAEEGRVVEVATYHGFAYGLLREFGALVGVERDVRIVTPGFARQLLREAIAAGAGYQHLNLTYIPGVLASAATLDAEAAEHLVDLHAPGLLEPADVAGPRRELVGIIERYRAEKERLHVVDYSDLLRKAVEMVTTYSEIADRVRSRYEAVLLDEYQDTSPAQRTLLQTIFGDGFPVTAVGDSDQTIYEWRGASPENFDGFPGHFQRPDGTPAETLELGVNWRSDAAIVDVANRVRDEMSATSPVTVLEPRPDAGAGTVETGVFATSTREANWIAGRIRQLHDEDGTALSDVAVLVRKNASIPLLLDAFEAHDIPVEVVSVGGLLSIPEVGDLHAWLRILSRPDDAPALVRVLHRSRFRLGLGDVATVARWVAEDRSRLLIDAAEDPGLIAGLRTEAAAALTEFSTLYGELLQVAQGVTLVELCRRILHRLGYWTEVESLGVTARLTSRLNLYRFLDVAQEWSPLEGRPSLEAFLDYLEQIRQDRGSDELDTARLSSDEAVTISTVHRAKGLEWPVVVLPHLVRKTFPSQVVNGFPNPEKRADRVPFALRLDAARFGSEDPTDFLRRAHDDQEWRTAYVAVTRAQHRLIATAAAWHPNRKTANAPSPLFDICDSGGTRLVSEEAPPEPPAFVGDDEADPAPDPLFPDGWKAATLAAVANPDDIEVDDPQYHADVEQMRLQIQRVDEVAERDQTPEQFTTSVTGLVTYASCPQRFYWSEVDRLPRRPAEWLRRGTEVHRQIELYNRGVVPFEDAGEDTYDLTAADDSEGGPGAFEVFSSSRFAATRPALIETPFALMLGDAVIRGRVDAVYGGDDFEVVDYKSGKPSKDPARRVQLQAYAVAAEERALGLDPPNEFPVTFAYFGGGSLHEETESATSEWRAEARLHLTGLIDRAIGGEFAPTPSAACHHCDFLTFCETGREFTSER
ncbi:MAG: ATP-dependent helicase [Acidimicrobiia bacterium]|nr:ATP-dependent helicase [Acidimicrobiia bacterium]